MDDALKAALKLVRKAGWTVEPPQSADVHVTEVKIKVGRVQPDGLTPDEIHASFRACGYTGAAIDFPLSARGYYWLCAFNGARPGETPWTWRYAPNAGMKDYLDRRAEAEGIEN